MTTKHDVHAAIATIEIAFRIIGERAPDSIEPDMIEALQEACMTLRSFADHALGVPPTVQLNTHEIVRPA